MFDVVPVSTSYCSPWGFFYSARPCCLVLHSGKASIVLLRLPKWVIFGVLENPKILREDEKRRSETRSLAVEYVTLGVPFFPYKTGP